jgi:hypothetical protein
MHGAGNSPKAALMGAQNTGRSSLYFSGKFNDGYETSSHYPLTRYRVIHTKPQVRTCPIFRLFPLLEKPAPLYIGLPLQDALAISAWSSSTLNMLVRFRSSAFSLDSISGPPTVPAILNHTSHYC